MCYEVYSQPCVSSGSCSIFFPDILSPSLDSFCLGIAVQYTDGRGNLCRSLKVSICEDPSSLGLSLANSSHLGLPRLQLYLNSRLAVSRFPFPNPQPEIFPQAVSWGNYRIYSFISPSRITVLRCLISKVLRGIVSCILSGFFVSLFFQEFQSGGSI